uniref:C2H2-type domain-containing protein n=2 Tax=Oncorhynchus TaxID=8016 RepID=A0A8C7ING7_ONCKI
MTHSNTHGSGAHNSAFSLPGKKQRLSQDRSPRAKPYQCPDCGKCFSEKRALTKHQKTHRRDSAPYWSGILQRWSQDPQHSNTDSDSDQDQDWTSL